MEDVSPEQGKEWSVLLRPLWKILLITLDGFFALLQKEEDRSMESQKWKITLSNPDWLEEEVVCEATSEELIDMTAESYEFREMLDENVVWSHFFESWCDNHDEEDYEGNSSVVPLHQGSLPEKTLRKEMIEGWEDQIKQQEED